MYTLRIFSKSNEWLERNHFLGNSYEFIKPSNKQLFKTLCEESLASHTDGVDELKNKIANCAGFITCENGVRHYINKKDICYIMSSNGKTFANISYLG